MQDKIINFIDTHVHLYDEAYDLDFNDVVERMMNAGVVKCILPAIDSSYYKRQEDCYNALNKMALMAVGLHPTSVNANWVSEYDFLCDKIHNHGVCAIGEIGLDGYWSKEYMNEQKEVFAMQLKLAEKNDLPVIVHLRDATEELFEVFDSLKGSKMRGVFHAYAGSFEMYERISSYGNFLFGIGGVVTYKNASIAKSLENIPLERIVLETDAPWLSPVPFRGKRNESANLQYIAEKIAQIKNSSIEEVSSITTRNAIKMFNIN